MSAQSNGIPTNKTAGLMAQLERFRANPRLLLLVSIAAAVAVVIAALLWARSPDYRVLYSNISDQDGGAVIAQLEQMKVPYRFSDSGGAIMVPADKVHDARLKLAQQGLPKGGAIGFELLDKEKFGISQFSEQVNYQRALEGELARTMETLGPVRNARVHLAIPKPSLFVREQKQPTASVTLNLYPGRTMDSGQVNAIAYMVSSAVPGLPVGNVTVVDQSGRLLTQSGSDEQSLNASQLKYIAEVEADYQQRIQSILAPVVGSQNVHAQVTAQIDFSTHEQTAEQYQPNNNPEKMALRSRQTSQSQQAGMGNVGGVPGALSNQPAPPPSAPIETPPAQGNNNANAGANNNNNNNNAAAGNTVSTNSTQSGPYSNRSDETANYEVDRTLTHTKRGKGNIERLSVAVVVNYQNDEEGKQVALSQAQMDQINQLVRGAMGYSTDRGDNLSVVNSPFTDNSELSVELPFWQQDRFIDLMLSGLRYLVVLLVAWILWRKGIRPQLEKQRELTRMQIEADKEARRAKPEAPRQSTRAEQEENARAQLRTETEMHSQTIRNMADQEPQVIALVIRQWLSKEQK
ncbi:flagellar M-ring protein FliF [Enterobacteriaceae bacterium BIT-l23]|uniref:flagellar basal-body MS-ring/collar protein FliF n=1 Tax=Jejubacter sp. L23 TaxID=3092086 RepID=UPI001585BD74|nr:flagellar M-ring protein FliF [Enterobacteriaceae bacterium BIT-l23]